MSNNSEIDKSTFESAIQALEAQIANAGIHLSIDAQTRQAYAKQVKIMADDLRSQVTSRKITWKQAASEAQKTRNVIMDIMRGRSTPIGRAIAERMKKEGKTLNSLIASKSQQLYGKNTNFKNLSQAKQNAVYAEIVKSAGKADVQVTTTMRTLSRAGRGLIVFSLALSIYTIVTAEDKGSATRREVAVTGAGFGGGIAGGAIAGLACGPGAPVCVTIGAFVGGALAAFGVDFFW